MPPTIRFALAFAFALTLSAQVDRATLVGTVTDSSGAVVVGVHLEIVSQETGLRREARSSATGTYTFPQMPIGVYTITADHAGFRSVQVKDLRLGVGDKRGRYAPFPPA